MRREFLRAGLGYTMTLPDFATELTVDRLTRMRGDLHGELKVSCGLPNTRSRTGLLHQARFNLSSAETRGRLSKTLAWRSGTGDGLDWYEVLEDLCTAVLDAERKGEPIVMVGALPRPASKPYRLDPILPLGDPVILYGEGGVGKSTLVTAVAVSVETGVMIVPTWIPRRAPVLYLDWESGPDAINERVAAIATGANLPNPVQIRYRFMARPLHDQAEEIAGSVATDRIGLVIVDSIGLAAGIGEGGDAAESAWRLFAAFRLLRSTVIAVDHVTKAAADDVDRPARPYGSAYKGYLARATFELRRVDTATGGSLGLFCTKYNDRAKLAPQSLRVIHENDRITYEHSELDDEFGARVPMATRIERVLAGQKMSIDDIADAIGARVPSVKTTLYRQTDRFSRLPSTGLWEVVGREASRAS